MNMRPIERNPDALARARKRVIVCGTTFGQVYLEALRQHGSFELAGILAHGSRRSQACAESYAVPLYREVGELPRDIDLACVVVRGEYLGGAGSELARRLMARGIHVLQEQPLHPDEVASSLRLAREQGVRFSLNSFYPHLPTVRRFIGAAHALLRVSTPIYIDAVAAVQVAYPLLDILRATLGKIRPILIEPAAPAESTGQPRSSARFRRLRGYFAGVPLELDIQNQLDPSDPDDHAHTLHRITLGTDAGDLTLLTTHGPVIWSARPQIPREMREAASTALFGESAPSSDDTCTAIFGPHEEPSQRTLFRTLWPQAARRALQELDQMVDENVSQKTAQSQLTLCRTWHEVSQKLGPPELFRNPAARRLSLAELARVRDEALAAGEAS